MIRVERADQPVEFEELTGNPGRLFLEKYPSPTYQQFANHNYWIRIKGNLYNEYSGICAYTCHYIPSDTGSDTVEHFIPKSVCPSMAYSWDNYRLVCGRLNGRKGDHQDVLDPFEIQNQMFMLDFPSLLVRPFQDLTECDRNKVFQTIKRLKLNDDETCVAARLEYVTSYCNNFITFDYLSQKAPFIASELVRQKMVNQIREIMSFN